MAERLKRLRNLGIVAVLVGFSVAACGDTWQGVKEDTKENVDATGKGIEKAGENIQKKVD
jgi:predicted small secreted protein